MWGYNSTSDFFVLHALFYFKYILKEYDSQGVQSKVSYTKWRILYSDGNSFNEKYTDLREERTKIWDALKKWKKI